VNANVPSVLVVYDTVGTPDPTNDITTCDTG
jgi:hypothetical protein